MTRFLSVLAAAVVTTAALVYALWGVDFARVADLLADAHYWVVGPFWVFLFLFFLFTGLRWNLILRPQGRYTLAQSTPAMMIGFASNNLLPAHLGELVRSVVFGQRYRVPAVSVFVTLVVERLLDVLAILLCYLAATVLIAPFPESFRVGAQSVTAIVVAACVLIAVFLRYPHGFVLAWERTTGWLPAPLRTRGTALLRDAETGLRALKSPVLIGLMLVYSLLKWLSCGVMVRLALLAFDAPIPFAVSLVVVAVVALAVTLPTAPGFLGTIQAAFVFALVPFGVEHETALAASVLYLLAQWIPVTASGVICFAAMGLRLREVREEAERLELET